MKKIVEPTLEKNLGDVGYGPGELQDPFSLLLRPWDLNPALSVGLVLQIPFRKKGTT